jgi:hypothetical protein
MKHRSSRKADQQEHSRVVFCDCKCPQWGKLEDGVYICRCVCGKEINACGACLQAGRVVDCGCAGGNSTTAESCQSNLEPAMGRL